MTHLGHRRPLIVLLIVTVALAAGCASAPPSAAPGSAAPTQLIPSFDPAALHAFPDLERRLPTEVGGRKLVVSSMRGEPDAAVEDAISVALQAAGAAGDLQLALASPDEDNQDLLVAAFRQPTLSGARLLEIVIAANADGTTASVELGGKQVTQVEDVDGTAWAYASNDVLFVVAGEPPAVEAALAALH